MSAILCQIRPYQSHFDDNFSEFHALLFFSNFQKFIFFDEKECGVGQNNFEGSTDSLKYCEAGGPK